MATVVLRPNGAGNSTQWAANGAGTNWGCVTSNDGDTTYISSATSGHVDLYTIDASALPTNAIISSIAISVRWRREAVVTITHSTRFRVGGTTYASQNALISGGSTAYQVQSPPLQSSHATICPSTGVAWTYSNISGMEIGYARSSGSTTIRATELYITVTYTLPSPDTDQVYFIGI